MASLFESLGINDEEQQAAPVKPEKAGVLRTMGDMAIKGAQGVVDLGASAVGLGNMVTGGLVGKGMDAIGYDPQRTNATMGEYLSSDQHAADQRVQDADGFFGTIEQAVQEPRFVAGSVMQSLPGLLAMGGMQGAAATAIAGRAALATAEGSAAAAGLTGAKAMEVAMTTQAGGAAAKAAIEANGTRLMALGAASEGAQTTGNIAQEAQHAGRNWADYAPGALAAGVGTAAIGYGAGKLMGDAGTEIFTGAHTKVGKTLPVRMAKSGISEGVLEEMPQSAQEEFFKNIAMGEDDLMKGVVKAGATGLVTGGAMGIGMGGFHGRSAAAPSITPQQAEADAIRATELVPEAGAMTRAANVGTEAKARAVESAPPVIPEDAFGQELAATQDDIRKSSTLQKIRDSASPTLGVTTDEFLSALGVAGDASARMDLRRMELDNIQGTVEHFKTGANMVPDMPEALGTELAALNERATGMAEVNPAPEFDPNTMDGQTRFVDELGSQRAIGGPRALTYDDPAPVEPPPRRQAVPQLQAGDIQNKLGKPFTNLFAAKNVSREAGVGYVPVKLGENAFVVRKVDTEINQAPALAAPTPAATETVATAQVEQTPDVQDVQPAPPAVAPAAKPTDHIGRDNKPLAEGGKPFKTKDEATAARQLQPMMRVVPAPSGKGFALAPKTEAQLATMPEATPQEAMTTYSLFGDSGHQEGGVLGESGKPFPTRESALSVLNKHPGGEIAEFSNGFVIRRPNIGSNASYETAAGLSEAQPPQNNNGNTNEPSELDQQAITGPGNQSGGSEIDAVAKPEPGQPGVFQDNTGSGAGSGSTSSVLLAGENSASVAKIQPEEPTYEPQTEHSEIDKRNAGAEKSSKELTQFKDGQTFGASELLSYFDQVIEGSEKGVIIPNPRFHIGEVGQEAALEIAKYIDGYSGQQRRLRVSGRTLKHIYESRPSIAREIIEQLPGMFSKPDEVLPDHKRPHKRALLVKAKGDSSKTPEKKSYVATVEIEIEVEIGDGFIDIVTIMTTPDRSLKSARELKNNWPEGQHHAFAHSPHPLTAEAANPAADFPDTRPINESVAQPAPESKSAAAILDAANITGKERIDVLKDVKKGDITTEELEAAYPAKAPASNLTSDGVGHRQDQTDTQAFKAWFGDSKVVDSEGKPLVMYHGTSKSEDGKAFTSFDTYASNYGLMGMGGYFTANPTVASSYTTKGKGESPTVYPVHLSIKNPIDMDAKANSMNWEKHFEDVDQYHEGGDSNESWYRAAEESLSDQGLPKWEGAEIMQDRLRAMGHDGITHIGGSRVKSDGVKHRVFIVFDPEQIKSATGNSGAFDPANPDIRYSRQEARTRGTPVPRVQAVVDAITANWANAPEVVVVTDMQDTKVPQRVREADQLAKSQGAEGEPDGFIYKGTVYLVAAELPTINDAIRVLFHEALGHSGLRGVFGDTLKPILSQVATMRRADVVAKAREYGLLNPGTPRGATVNEQWQAMTEKNKRVAAEEVLAVMAQTHPELGFVKRAISAIRNWLRTNVPGLKSMDMTDADIIQEFILPARRHIEGKQASRPVKNTNLEAIAQRESNLLDLIACLG